MENRLLKAIQLATEAHSGQLDKAGYPYIYHPYRVSALVAHLGEDYAIVGILHDVVEDTPVDLDTIYSSFGETVGDAVLAVTHMKPPKFAHEPYFDYIHRAKKNTIGRAVKLADLADNTSPARWKALPENERIGLGKRYAKAKKILEAD